MPHVSLSIIFADDTTTTLAASTMTDLEDAVNLELRNLQRWLITNRLRLNFAKTEFMVIGPNQPIHALSNNQIDIEKLNRLARLLTDTFHGQNI